MADNDSTNEFTQRRDSRDAHKLRLVHAAVLLKIFKHEVGRPARDTDELGAWFVGSKNASLKGLADPMDPRVDPANWLTTDEIEAAARGS